LVFSSNALQTNTTNNFPAGTSFESIGITGPNYTLAGNEITLRGGLSGDRVVTGIVVPSCSISLMPHGLVRVTTFQTHALPAKMLIAGVLATCFV
jgi:hypothetical protein